MYKIHQQHKAHIDLKNIWHYSYENHGEKQADKYYDELIVAMETIQQNPQIGIACDHVRMGYRYYRAKEHFIFYRVTKQTIHIIRILHQNMDAVLQMTRK